MTRFILLLPALLFLSACQTSSSYAWLNDLSVPSFAFGETQQTASLEMGPLQSKPATFEQGAPMFIRIFKQEGTLEVWREGDEHGKYALYKSYPICRYSPVPGPKIREGDLQSPEGFYDVTYDWLKPESKYHLAMNIGYPNEYDQQWGRTGNKLMIHGGCASEGCFAMTDPGIEEIYTLAEASLLAGNEEVPVHIFPFRMTPENMRLAANSPWMPFWENLKEGYDMFERDRMPPQVAVMNTRYVFMPQPFNVAQKN